MRDIPGDILSRVQNPIQTRANGANPQLSFWISRPTIPLTDKDFLEISIVTTDAASASPCCVAVRHLHFGRQGDKVYVGYIKNNQGYVRSTPNYTDINRYTWTQENFLENATEIEVCFDGTMPKNTRNKYEFITEQTPWVFWCYQGAAYGRLLGDDSSTIALASSLCTKVSAVRGMWSEISEWDFGLCLFMIIDNQIYYRQRIGGEWKDAVPVPSSALPSGRTWIDVNAQRTWDYRICLQAMDVSGDIFEVFTQYGGFGSKGAEHLKVSNISATGELTEIGRRDIFAPDEHIEVSAIQITTPYGGLYSIDAPVMVSARNVNDGTGNYGSKIEVTFNVHLNSSTVSNVGWQVLDSGGKIFTVGAGQLLVDGKTVLLTVGNFNNANGNITVSYTPGSLVSMADTTAEASNISFTPTGLVPTTPPQVTSITNI